LVDHHSGLYVPQEEMMTWSADEEYNRIPAIGWE